MNINRAKDFAEVYTFEKEVKLSNIGRNNDSKYIYFNYYYYK